MKVTVRDRVDGGQINVELSSLRPGKVWLGVYDNTHEGSSLVLLSRSEAKRVAKALLALAEAE